MQMRRNSSLLMKTFCIWYILESNIFGTKSNSRLIIDDELVIYRWKIYLFSLLLIMFFDEEEVVLHKTFIVRSTWVYHRFPLILLTIHSKPWYRPSPDNAQHAWMCHWWFRMDCRFSCFEISAALIQPLTS